MDIHLPMAPVIVVELNTTEFMVQLMVIISVALTTMTPIFWGYLSDCCGRRKVFFPACIFLVVGQFLCAVAPTIHFLLAARFIQYLGAGALFSVNMSIICDQYTGQKRAQMLALWEMTLPIAFVIAPIFGAFFASAIHWRFSFFFLGLCQLITIFSLFKKLPETLASRKSFSLNQIRTVTWHILKNKTFTRYSLLLAFVNAPYMIFITHSAFFYIDHFKYTPSRYAFIHSTLVFVYLIGVMVFQKLVRERSLSEILNRSMWGILLFAILNTFMSFGILPFNMGWVTLCMLISCMVSGPIIATCNSLALSSHDDYLGTCSALVELFFGTVAGLSMFLSSLLMETYGPRSVYLLMAITAFISVALWILRCGHTKAYQENDKSPPHVINLN